MKLRAEHDLCSGVQKCQSLLLKWFCTPEYKTKKELMKKYRFIIFLLFSIIAADPLCAEETISMVTTDFCPYVCISEKEDGRNGFVLDIFRYIFEKKGYAVKFEIQPWTRALKTYNDKGPFDGILAATKIHPINKEIAVFPETEICRYTHKFYALKDSPLVGKWKYTGVESLKNIQLGAIKDWSYSSAEVTKYVNDGGSHVNPMYGSDLVSRNMGMLLKKHTELYVENEFMVSYFLYKEKKAGNKKMENIVPADSVPIDEGAENSYPVFYKDKNGEKYAKIFTEGMKELRNSKLDSIMAGYGLEDWRK